MRTFGLCLAAVCLAVCTVAIWSPVVQCDFVNFDDGLYVYENGPVLQGVSRYTWKYAWTSLDCSNWHPLTWLSLQLDSTLQGRTASGFHATNLALHTLNTLLVLICVYELTGHFARSFVVAALFSVHPLHVESVAWISERKDVLSTSFLLLTVLAYIQYARSPSLIRWACVTVLYGFGLLAKPMLVTLPLLMMCLDYWPLNRGRDKRLMLPWLGTSIPWILAEKIPLLFLAAADGVITLIAQQDATNAIQRLSKPVQIANAFNALGWYLQKTLIPADLMVFYPHPGDNLPVGRTIIGLGVFILVTVWVLRLRDSRKHLLFGWAWFIISLLPVLGLIQVGGQAYADRYTYVPHIGLFVAIVWEIGERVMHSRIAKVASVFVLVAVLVGFGTITRRQTEHWQNSMTLWTHAIQIDHGNEFAHLNLAGDLESKSRFSEAITHLELGRRFLESSRLAAPWSTWGKCLEGLKQSSEAEAMYQRALSINPKHIPSLNALWRLMHQKDRHQEGEIMWDRLVKAMEDHSAQRPYSAVAQNNLGHLELGRGNIRAALKHYEMAVRLDPSDANSWVGRATAELKLNLPNVATTDLEHALQLAPYHVEAHLKLALVLLARGDFSKARDHIQEVLRIDPGNQEAPQILKRLPAPD